MDYKIDDVIEFKNGEYLILDVIKNKENTYLYLINNDEYKDDISIVKVNFNNNIVEYSVVDNDKEFEFIIDKIFVNFRKDMEEFVKQE